MASSYKEKFGSNKLYMFQLIQLRDDHPTILGNSNSVKQGIATVESNINWVSLNKGEIDTWLAAHQPAKKYSKIPFVHRQQLGLPQLLD